MGGRMGQREELEGYVVVQACLREYPQDELVSKAKEHTRECALMGHCVESATDWCRRMGGPLLLEPASTPGRAPPTSDPAAIMFGFLLQWPTLLTLAVFPILVWMHLRLARAEERNVTAEFGDTYRLYAERVPAFVPRWPRPVRGPA